MKRLSPTAEGWLWLNDRKAYRGYKYALDCDRDELEQFLEIMDKQTRQTIREAYKHE